MGCDMVVALGAATVDGQTLFGQNIHRPGREGLALQRVPGRDFALGEKVRTQYLELPQARSTSTVLGCRPEGLWGYLHGVNQHALAVGCAAHPTRLGCPGPGLLGTDLVRLTLERCRSARQGVDLVGDLVERYGQGPFPGAGEDVEGDSALLIADPAEAFAVEASGRYWVYQEIRQVRAVSDVSVIRQDWDRIAHGLAGQAIDQGWWPGDGSKLDFAGALSTAPTGLASGLRRWGRATLLLEVQNGHIDPAFLRRLLSDHYEGTREEVDPLDAPGRPLPVCRHATGACRSATAASFIAPLRADPGRLPVLWCAPGPPCLSVYLPVFLGPELPGPFARAGDSPYPDSLWWRSQQFVRQIGSNRHHLALARESMERLQANLDQEAEGFAAEAAVLQQKGSLGELHRRAGLFMEHVVDQFERALEHLEAAGLGAPARAEPALPR